MNDDELSELEYVQCLMSDLGLTPEDTIADLLEAIRDDEIDSFLEEVNYQFRNEEP